MCIVIFNLETSQAFQITTLTCTGRKVIVGTSIGAVAVFDSETVSLLNYFSWHKDKVRTLLVMPKQVNPCICAEVPFPHQDIDVSSRQGQEMHMNSRKAPIMKRLAASTAQNHRNFTSQFSYLENKYCVSNPDPDSVLITSVGNGKEGYSVVSQSKEDRVKEFDMAAKRRSAYRTGARPHWEDIVLLTWKS